MDNVIYEKNHIYNPFIITQIGECQNEFILSPHKLFVDKDNFSKSLYAQVDSKNISDTFLRTYAYKDDVVLVCFWATNITEELSQRKGLYVVCGIVVDKDVFSENSYLAGYYFFQLMSLLAQYTQSEVNSLNSDDCYLKLQMDAYAIMNSLYETYCHFITSNPCYKKTIKQHRFLWKKRKSESYKIMPIFDSLYDKMQIFIYESLVIYKENVVVFDVSTNSKVSPFFIEFIKNGSIISSDIKKADVISRDKIKYIKIFY